MGIKMDKTSIIVCSVVGSLGLLSAVLGFSAEGTKLTPYTILDDGYDCIYPPNPAIGLGICAAIFLLVAQVVCSAVSGCCGCCRSRSFPSETKRIVAIVCAVFSWIAAVIAFALFIDGAALNASVVRVGQAPYCTYLKDGVFAGAGILALAATALGITSFIMQRTQQPPAAPAAAPTTPTPTDGGQSPAPAGVVIGRPLLPLPPSSDKPPMNDYPVKPHGYEQQQQPNQVLPTDQPHHRQPQGYHHAQPPQNPQFAPPAAQANVSHYHAPNHHQLPPRPDPAVAAAAAAPAVAVATAVASEPSVLQPVLGAVAVGQPLPQVPVPLPSVPAPAAATGNGGGQTLTSAIRNEVARQGIKMAAEVVRHSLFSSDNNNATGDVIAMMTDSSGGDAVQATN